MKIVHIQSQYKGKEKLQLILFTAFCFAMLIVRMIYTNSFEYRFMGINLLLAWIPYLLVLRIIKLNTRGHKIQIGILLFLWLIFFPNAPYMITDIYHLEEFDSAPTWFDLIMLLSFAWTGMMLAFISFRKLHRRFLRMKKTWVHLVTVFSIFFSCGIGIYLGRYERWNSWEIITQPRVLTTEFLQLLNNQLAVAQMLSLSVVFGAFFTLIYLFVFTQTKPVQISDKA